MADCSSVLISKGPNRPVAHSTASTANDTSPPMHAPIFILGCHKSGTSLLRALLDGHPDLFVVPVETHPFVHLSKWVRYFYRKTLPQTFDRARFIASVIAWIDACNKADDPRGGDGLMHPFDLAAFRNTLTRQSVLNEPDAIIAYFHAIAAALSGPDLTKQSHRIVEKSVDNLEYAALLKKWFPDACFLHVIRNPYANLVALRVYKSTPRYPSMMPLLSTIYDSYYYLYKNQQCVDDYVIVRYEDLVCDVRNEIHKIATAIRLRIDDSLLTPTAMGRPWQGNSTSRKSFQGLSQEPLQRWRSQINALEIYLINKNLHHVLLDFGYDQLAPSHRRLLLPCKNEQLMTYIANRFAAKADSLA